MYNILNCKYDELEITVQKGTLGGGVEIRFTDRKDGSFFEIDLTLNQAKKLSNILDWFVYPRNKKKHSLKKVQVCLTGHLDENALNLGVTPQNTAPSMSALNVAEEFLKSFHVTGLTLGTAENTSTKTENFSPDTGAM